ncbi:MULTISPECIES: hypothetical protein [Streptomyces]
MEQAPTPTPATFQHATAIVRQVIPLLDPEQRPFAVEVEEDWPTGWRAHLKFRELRAAGLLQFAALLGVPVAKTQTAFGVHLDAITRIEDVEVRASALVSPQEAERLEAPAVPAPAPQPPVTVQAAAHPVPLGSSVLAAVPSIVSPQAAPVVQTDGQDEAGEAVCARCGCTENAACEGGCHWVPNAWMVDLCSACVSLEELATLTTYPPAAAAVAEAGR